MQRATRRHDSREHDAGPLGGVARLLDAWAEWRLAGDPSGFPPHSWEGRAQLRGGSRPEPATDSTPRLHPRDSELEVELLVQQMPARYRRALEVRYLARWRGRPLSTEAQAALYGASKATLRRRTARAVAWLDGRLRGRQRA